MERNVWKRFGVVVLSLLVLFLGACSNQTDSVDEETESAAESSQEAALTITDQTGKEITFEEPVEEIVAILPSEAEILFAIGAGDKIVARGEYVDYPAEEVADIPVVSSYDEANAEEIVALDPDVILLSVGSDEDYVRQLEDAGIAVVQFDADSIEDVYSSIELMGQLVDRQEEAVNLIEEMKATFAEIEEKTQDGDPQSVYYEISPLAYGLWTAGDGTFMNEIGNLMNLENLFADVDEWAEISEEQVIERAPEWIITTTSEEGAVEEIMNRTGWDQIPAVQKGQVIEAEDSEFTRPGPRLMDAAQRLYDLVYGSGSSEDDQESLDEAA